MREYGDAIVVSRLSVEDENEVAETSTVGITENSCCLSFYNNRFKLQV